MKTNTLHLPEYLTNTLSKLTKDFEVNIAFKKTYVLVVVKCHIKGTQYTASTRYNLRDRMCKILEKIENCVSEIQDIYDLDCEVSEKTSDKKSCKKKIELVEQVEALYQKETVTDQTEPKKILGLTLQEISEMCRVDREQRKLSMEKYAVYAGIPYSTYWKVEKCKSMPSEGTVQKLIDYVFGKAK